MKHMRTKRLMAWLLSAALIITQFSAPMYAHATTIGGNLCEHHTEHIDCDYIEGTDRNHVHDADCVNAEDKPAQFCNIIAEEWVAEESEATPSDTKGTPCTFECHECYPEDSDIIVPGVSSITVTAFDDLETAVQQQTVAVGTELTALNLPIILEATGYTVSDTEVVDSSTPSDATTTSAEITIKCVKWELNSENEINNGNSIYDPAQGAYCFTPILPEGYTPAEGVALPEIWVMVGGAMLMSTWANDADIDWYDDNSEEFHLTTEAELAGLAKLVNKEEKLFAGKTIYLEKDLDLSGKNWDSIGSGNNVSAYFGGTFDGQYHTIANMTQAEFSGYSGLFGAISNEATIQNLGIVDADVKTATYTSNGILAAWVNNSKVVNCYTTGSIVSAHESGGFQLVGGLIGQCTGNSQVIGCYSTAAVTSRNLDDDSDTVGGLIGQWENSGSDSLISDCWFDGTINCEYTDSGVGGILGANFDFYGEPGVTISNCLMATSEVQSAESGNITWIAAVVDAPIINCYWPQSEDTAAVVKLILEGNSAAADPDFDERECGTAVDDFLNGDMLLGLQQNADANVTWVAGIQNPTFDWDKRNIPADYTEVDRALTKIPDDLSVYTAKTVKVLNEVKSAVVRGKSILEQAKVDGYAVAIESAIAALTRTSQSVAPAFENAVVVMQSATDTTASFTLTNSVTGNYKLYNQPTDGSEVQSVTVEVTDNTLILILTTIPTQDTIYYVSATKNDEKESTRTAITVKAYVQTTGITLNKSTMALQTGGTETLTAIIAPETATNKSVAWMSSSSNVATVDVTGKVTAVSEGATTITATAADGQTITCAVIVTKPSGGGGSTGGDSYNPPTPPTAHPTEAPTPPTIGTIKPPVTVDENGNVTTKIPDDKVQEAIKKAIEQAAKNGTTASGTAITVTLDVEITANSLTATLSRPTVDRLIEAKVEYFSLTSSFITLRFDLEALKQMRSQSTGEVTIKAVRQDVKKLSAAAQTAIGSRPAMDITVWWEKDGTMVNITNFGKGNIAVGIPYTKTAVEQTGYLYGVYVDSDGNVTYLINSSYDIGGKMLMFSTNHLSVYGVAYKAPTPAFTDTANHWAKDDMEFVAARGLLSGTGTTFAPDTSMTRGMFVTALGRLAGVDTKTFENTKFTDVKADAYYAPYVAWANVNGIVNGTTETTFSPDNAITRQELAVMLVNYNKAIGYKLTSVHAKVVFADSASIDAWAADAVKQMQMAGILMGKSDNKFDPAATATRAEVSAMLRRYVELLVSTKTAEGWAMNESGQWMYIQDGKRTTGKKTVDGISYEFDQYGVTLALPPERG